MEGTEIKKEGEYSIASFTGLSDIEIRLECLKIAIGRIEVITEEGAKSIIDKAKKYAEFVLNTNQ